MPKLQIPEELLPRILSGNLDILCPLDNRELKLGTTTHPYGGVSRDYNCQGCGANYTEGAVIRAALDDLSFLERQARQYHFGLETQL